MLSIRIRTKKTCPIMSADKVSVAIVPAHLAVWEETIDTAQPGDGRGLATREETPLVLGEQSSASHRPARSALLPTAWGASPPPPPVVSLSGPWRRFLLGSWVLVLPAAAGENTLRVAMARGPVPSPRQAAARHRLDFDLCRAVA